VNAPSVVVVTLSADELRTLVREAVRVELASVAPASATPAALVDKRTAAHALGISTTGLDRLTAAGRVPYVRVGDVRRYDLAAVRAALETTAESPATPAPRERVAGVRLLSRRSA
jgi:hypothetical protein